MSSSLSIDRPRYRECHSDAESQNKRGITFTTSMVLVLLLALALLLAGGCMMLAGISSYQAEAFINDWEKAGHEPKSRAWQIAHNAAQRAISMYPVANGDYFDRLGRVHSWKQFSQPYADPAAEDSRQSALDAYRAAVNARPAWPYSWVRFAHTKLYLQEFDNEFDQAFTQALQLGAWRIGVNRELAEIGFSAWPKLDEEQRQSTLESARRSVVYGPREAQRMLKIAQHTGMNLVLCNSLNSELKTARKLCL